MDTQLIANSCCFLIISAFFTQTYTHTVVRSHFVCLSAVRLWCKLLAFKEMITKMLTSLKPITLVLHFSDPTVTFSMVVLWCKFNS